MTREEVILSHIKRDGLGLEIGAGCAPIAPKKHGFRVHVFDHCDKNALIEKYRPHGSTSKTSKRSISFGTAGLTSSSSDPQCGERGTYLDVHEWCFTPTSFRLMMRDLFELGFIRLKELAFPPSLRAVSFTSRSRAPASCRRAPALICCRRFIANNPSPEQH